MANAENLKKDMIKQELYYCTIRLHEISTQYKMSEYCHRDILAVAKNLSSIKNKINEL